jgi:hypothetical protein
MQFSHDRQHVVHGPSFAKGGIVRQMALELNDPGVRQWSAPQGGKSGLTPS